MQKIATRVFIYSSIAFGVVGILLILIGGPDGNSHTLLEQVLRQLLLITVCIILSSFALSVAGKYLKVLDPFYHTPTLLAELYAAVSFSANCIGGIFNTEWIRV